MTKFPSSITRTIYPNSQPNTPFRPSLESRFLARSVWNSIPQVSGHKLGGENSRMGGVDMWCCFERLVCWMVTRVCFVILIACMKPAGHVVFKFIRSQFTPINAECSKSFVELRIMHTHSALPQSVPQRTLYTLENKHET